MNISKAIINYAARRNIDIDARYFETVEMNDGEIVKVNNVWFAVIREDGEVQCEPMFVYAVNGNHLRYNGHCAMEKEIAEELPATIDSDKKLKEVIKFIESEMKAGNIE
ncbi:hypothetical protein [Photorhabdus hindustanensis]|uniref:Uncharacterized protein n=1 Tax=Photorhabdus hindustanensis TaxID=2918802 RepID=A0A2S8PU41_9GAMM|nr:hypothetical protein [Photorhabdus hindustanensis]PQQ22288.1 hypothetical protein C6H66_24130 [Photorhabdus hindustanensis]